MPKYLVSHSYTRTDYYEVTAKNREEAVDNCFESKLARYTAHDDDFIEAELLKKTPDKQVKGKKKHG